MIKVGGASLTIFIKKCVWESVAYPHTHRENEVGWTVVVLHLELREREFEQIKDVEVDGRWR